MRYLLLHQLDDTTFRLYGTFDSLDDAKKRQKQQNSRGYNMIIVEEVK